MALVYADTHYHLYPAHDAAESLYRSARRLIDLARGQPCMPMLFLTEAKDYHFYAALQAGDLLAAADVRVDGCAESACTRLTWADSLELWIFAGRQHVTAEGLEILALTSERPLADRLKAEDVVDQVLDEGAVPVLSWAPGKWMFRRRHAVAELLQRYPANQLLLGDTSLRARGWPQPAPMRSRDRHVLCGSDPLPQPGEEDQAGRYGVAIEAPFDPERPVASVRAFLFDVRTEVTPIGCRNAPHVMIRRLMKHECSKRGGR